MTDEQTWLNCHPDDLWIFDKLLLAKKLNYVCGPKGVEVPLPAYYIIRPCVNINGMGAGAFILNIEKKTDHLPAGSFWCIPFEGRHLSIDYYKGQQVLCVEGIRAEAEDLTRWNMWTEVPDIVPFPEVAKKLIGDYEFINVEMIGGRIIEVHLRNNPDFEGHTSDYVIPVWKGEKVKPDADQEFISRPDGDRLGFYIRKDRR